MYTANPTRKKMWNASETRQFCCPWVHHHDIHCHILKKYPLKIVGKSHLFAMLLLRSSWHSEISEIPRFLAEHLPMTDPWCCYIWQHGSHPYTPVMLACIPAPWILWVAEHLWKSSKHGRVFQVDVDQFWGQKLTKRFLRGLHLGLCFVDLRL